MDKAKKRVSFFLRSQFEGDVVSPEVAAAIANKVENFKEKIKDMQISSEEELRSEMSYVFLEKTLNLVVCHVESGVSIWTRIIKKIRRKK
jgi:hypothetical protein